MKYKELAYYNGKISALSEMNVPMLDRGCYFGDGIYEACIASGNRMLGIDDHLDRCYNSMKLVSITPPMEKGEMKSLLMELCDMMESDTNFVYWQVTRGSGHRNHAFKGAETGSSFWVMITPKTFNSINAEYKLISAEDLRFYYCNIKTLNLLPNVMYNQRALEAGADETILHRGERVTECSHSNVSILKDGVFRTAQLDNLILPGVTRKHLIALCGDLGIPVVEEAFTLDELRAADEVIISSSSNLCARGVELDGQPVGGKDPDTLRRLREAYAAKVMAECGIQLVVNS